MRQEVFIHIAVNELFITAELKENPSLRGLPLIIGSETAGVKKGDVIAVSAPAAALGLLPGISVRRALKAVPEAELLPARYEAWEALSESFFQILREASQSVESLGLDEAFMSSVLCIAGPDGVEKSYEAAEKLASALQVRIREELGLHTAAGVGPNKLIARLAGLEAGKDGLKVVMPVDSAAFIKTLPLSILPDVDLAVEKRLVSLGLNTIAEIAETPLLFLTKNFGASTGKIFYESSQARGAKTIMPFYDEDGLSREVAFDKGLREPLIIKETLYMLAEGLTARLKAEGAAASGLALKVTFSDLRCEVTGLELDEETGSFNAIWAGVLELLERVSISGNIILLGLKFSGLKKKTTS